MKKSKFTDSQIAFILRQAEEGSPWSRFAARLASRPRRATADATSAADSCPWR